MHAKMGPIELLKATEEVERCGRAGQHQRVIEMCTGLMGQVPAYAVPHLHWSRGEAYAALGRYDEAIADYEVPWAPDDVGESTEGARRWRLAGLLKEARREQQAAGVLRELVEYCTMRIGYLPDVHRYYYERGRARAELKELTEALADCRQAQAVRARRASGEAPTEAEIALLERAVLARIQARNPQA